MIQEIFTYFIIAISLYIATYKIYKAISPIFSKKKKFTCCGGCSACSLKN
jgi:hypothetical protein